jgi:hypothetical protein
MSFYLISVIGPVFERESFLLRRGNDVSNTEMIADLHLNEFGVTIGWKTEGSQTSNLKVKMVSDVSF